MAEHADLIIENGRLITFDATNGAATAVAVKGYKILATGTDDEVRNLEGPETRTINAQGRTVLPGFIESHVHLFPGGAELGALNLFHVNGAEELAKAASGFGKEHPDHELVYGVCCDYETLGEGHSTTRQDLDKVMPGRPFAMMAHDHHTVWANTKALEKAGILHGGEVPEGCEIVMGEDGKATGELRETGAFGPVLELTPFGGRDGLGYVTGANPEPMPTASQRASDRAAMLAGLEHCARHGITTLHNMDGNFYQLELLDEMHHEGQLLCRTQIPCHLKNFDPLEKLEEAEEMRRRFDSNMLWSNRVKIFMDGVIESRTAFMLQPYPDEPGSVGDALFSSEHFNEVCTKADAMGLQISVHAIGDGAVRRTLDGYEAAAKVNGKRDSRHRIEHIEVLHKDDLHRFKELGVIASMQPLHSPAAGLFDAPPPGVILHEEQKPLFCPWQTLRDTGVTMIFSTDWPVVPVDVMASVKGAVAPRNLGAPWTNQHQSLHDALCSYTRDGAYAEFSEVSKGQLKPGMLADIVMMSHDLEAMEPETLADARAELTICGGRITFEA
ncbi:MAG: amidohydrolase [Hyphomicrobiales bacterium]